MYVLPYRCLEMSHDAPFSSSRRSSITCAPHHLRQSSQFTVHAAPSSVTGVFDFTTFVIHVYIIPCYKTMQNLNLCYQNKYHQLECVIQHKLGSNRKIRSQLGTLAPKNHKLSRFPSLTQRLERGPGVNDLNCEKIRRVFFGSTKWVELAWSIFVVMMMMMKKKIAIILSYIILIWYSISKTCLEKDPMS